PPPPPRSTLFPYTTLFRSKPLVYLDSASSSQKPRTVLDAMEHHHRHHYANVHRGIYTIAEESTAAYEGARAKVAKLLNARATGEDRKSTRLNSSHLGISYA